MAQARSPSPACDFLVTRLVDTHQNSGFRIPGKRDSYYKTKDVYGRTGGRKDAPVQKPRSAITKGTLHRLDERSQSDGLEIRLYYVETGQSRKLSDRRPEKAVAAPAAASSSSKVVQPATAQRVSVPRVAQGPSNSNLRGRQPAPAPKPAFTALARTTVTLPPGQTRASSPGALIVSLGSAISGDGELRKVFSNGMPSSHGARRPSHAYALVIHSVNKAREERLFKLVLQHATVGWMMTMITVPQQKWVFKQGKAGIYSLIFKDSNDKKHQITGFKVNDGVYYENKDSLRLEI